MFCTKCGKERVEGAGFCAFCGGPLGPAGSLRGAVQANHPAWRRDASNAAKLKHVVFISVSALIICFALLEFIRSGLSHNDGDSAQSTSNFDPGASTVDPGAATANAPPLQVPGWNCVTDPDINSIHVRGEVRNSSATAIDQIEAVATFRTSDGTFVKSSDALIEYQPLMPGQASPFTIPDHSNPAIQIAELAFKELSGGSIVEFLGTKTLKCTLGD